MRETKLRRLLWGIAIGTFAIIVAMVLVWKFRFYDDVTAQLNTTQTQYQTAATTGATLVDNLRTARIEEQKLVLAQEKLDYFRARFRSMEFDLEDEGVRQATWIRYMNEYFQEFGVTMRNLLIAVADETGVVINTTIQVEQPPQMPENVVAPPSGFLKPTEGAAALEVTITGSYPDTLRFFDRLNSRSSVVFVVGNVLMEGTSPEIETTFTISPYLMTRGQSALVAAPPGSPAAAPPVGDDGTGVVDDGTGVVDDGGGGGDAGGGDGGGEEG